MSNEQLKPVSERDYKLDILRFAAIFLVVVIHVSNYYNRFLPEVDSIPYFAATFYNAFARVSVPVFFMISGALNLNRDIPAKKLRSKIVHFLIILVFWSLVYIVFDILYMGYHFSIKHYFSILFHPLKPHLWFMYAIIALYLITPFVRTLCAHMAFWQKRYFVWLWFFFCGVVRLLQLVFNEFGVNSEITYAVPIVQGTYYLGYYMVGYFIYEEIKASKEGHSEGRMPVSSTLTLTVFCLSIIAATVCTAAMTIHDGKFYDDFFNYRNALVIAGALAAYIFVLQKPAIKSEKVKKFLDTASPLLFGVYLIHIIFFDLLIRTINIKVFNCIWSVPVLALLVFAVSFVSVLILSKIPVVKKLIK